MTEPERAAGVTAHPQLTGALTDSVRAAPGSWRRTASTIGFDDPYLTLTVDTIEAPDGQEHQRVVVHPRRAVAVAAIDDERRILLVEQYRHPMGRRVLEIPAGLMDVEGEQPQQAAARELAEEADLLAGSWRELMQIAPTVGYSTEILTVFHVTDLAPVAEADRIVREAEEADMTHWWVDLDEAVAACLDGRIFDAKTVIAILAVART